MPRGARFFICRSVPEGCLFRLHLQHVHVLLLCFKVLSYSERDGRHDRHALSRFLENPVRNDPAFRMGALAFVVNAVFAFHMNCLYVQPLGQRVGLKINDQNLYRLGRSACPATRLPPATYGRRYLCCASDCAYPRSLPTSHRHPFNIQPFGHLGLLGGEHVGVSLGDLNTLMTDALCNGNRRETHVDQQRYMLALWLNLVSLHC